MVTSDNYKEYISLPKFIIKKFEKGIISYTAFSELIRLELLSVYGGIWIDATVFIHKPVTVSLEDEPFYTLKGVSSLKRGEFLGFVPVYFMGCREKYDAVVEVRDYLFSYWEANNKQIDYFLIDYCFKLVYLTDISFSKIMNSHPLVGADRFLLINMINKEYNFSNLMKINSCKYGVFKLSNKYKLEEEDSSEKLTFGAICLEIGLYNMKNIKNFFHVLLLQGGNYIFPLVTIPIASRIFGPDLIGKFNYYTYIVSLCCMIVEFGFGYSGVRLLTRDYENKSSIFNRILLAKFFILLFVSFISACYLFWFIDKSDIFLYLACYLLVLSSLFNVNWFFQSTGDFGLITKVSVLTKIISIALIVLLVRNKKDLLAYTLFINIPLVFSSVFSFCYCILKYKIKVCISKFIETILLIKDEVWIFLSKISSFLYTTMGVIFLGFFATTYDVGIYTSAQKIVMLFISVIITPLSFIVFPALSKRFGISIENGLIAFRKFMPLLCLCCFLSFLFIYFLGGKVILIMMGAGFKDSIQILNILAFGYVFVFWGL